jgi:dCTP deaminase
MILTHDEIIKEMCLGRIKISPFDRSAVGPASVDLSLGSSIRIFKNSLRPVEAKESVDYKKFTRLQGIKKGYILGRGELVLGITKEKITLPDNLCGWLQSRSRFARVGLMSHVTAPFICPGVSNRQVLEIFNAGDKPLKIYPGVKICQLILEECRGKAKYSGRFRKQ